MNKTVTLLALIAASSATQAVQVEALGNDGIAIRTSGEEILIDAVYRHYPDWEGFQYDPMSGSLTQGAASNLAPQILAFTHVHRDHFHPESAGAWIDGHKQARILGGQQLIESVREGYVNARRIDTQLACLGTDGCQASFQLSGNNYVEGFPTTHSHPRHSWVENISYVVHVDGLKILHLGDSALSPENTAKISQHAPQVDIVFAPFWYVLDDTQLGRFLEEAKPKKVAFIHIPAEQVSLIAQKVELLNDTRLSVPAPNFTYDLIRQSAAPE